MDADERVREPQRQYVRVGIIVPKYKHSIVERNRLRRRLRELVRTRLLPVIAPCDVVIRPFPQAYHATFEMLAADIARVVERLG